LLYSQNNNRNIPLQHETSETPTDIGTTNSGNIVLQLQQNTQQQNYPSSSSGGPIRIKQTKFVIINLNIKHLLKHLYKTLKH